MVCAEIIQLFEVLPFLYIAKWVFWCPIWNVSVHSPYFLHTFFLLVYSHPNLLFLFSMSIKQNWWQDSPPGRNYTSFELWPVFLTFGTTTGFVTNIIDPFRYLCGWSDTELMRNFKDSSKTGEMRVAEKEIISQIKLSLFLSCTDYARIFIFYWNLIEASFI